MSFLLILYVSSFPQLTERVLKGFFVVVIMSQICFSTYNSYEKQDVSLTNFIFFVVGSWNGFDKDFISYLTDLTKDFNTRTSVQSVNMPWYDKKIIKTCCLSYNVKLKCITCIRFNPRRNHVNGMLLRINVLWIFDLKKTHLKAEARSYSGNISVLELSFKLSSLKL